MKAAAGEARLFPWDDMIGLGLGLLRLAPRDFWTMTPREMAHVLRLFSGSGVSRPPERGSLDVLMALFPDDLER